MDEQEILSRISALVEQENGLRGAVQKAELTPGQEQAQLRRVEETLDQCWDLLRQRRARRDAGQEPDETAVRSADQVEGYRQ